LLGLDVVEALRMASAYPAAFLRLDGELGRIAPGQRANLALLDRGMHVTRTWIDGSPG
jgi:N-acetylglucosamine-6-phosphate deacetylase